MELEVRKSLEIRDSILDLGAASLTVEGDVLADELNLDVVASLAPFVPRETRGLALLRQFSGNVELVDGRVPDLGALDAFFPEGAGIRTVSGTGTLNVTLSAPSPQDAGGEIDLVVRQGRTLVFVEVKSTSEGSWSRGFERIDAAKRRSLRRACRAYLQSLSRRPRTYRLDAVSVRFTAGLLGPRVREILWEKGFFPIDE